mmetsp:Transcript_59805/g.165370  ORF Transcript_59805/g.165370 Transcript_59805/m.165370 type:complete len:321 (-) Transcript_59805:50-1012(-)
MAVLARRPLPRRPPVLWSLETTPLWRRPSFWMSSGACTRRSRLSPTRTSTGAWSATLRPTGHQCPGYRGRAAAKYVCSFWMSPRQRLPRSAAAPPGGTRRRPMPCWQSCGAPWAPARGDPARPLPAASHHRWCRRRWRWLRRTWSRSRPCRPTWHAVPPRGGRWPQRWRACAWPRSMASRVRRGTSCSSQRCAPTARAVWALWTTSGAPTCCSRAPAAAWWSSPMPPPCEGRRPAFGRGGSPGLRPLEPCCPSPASTRRSSRTPAQRSVAVPLRWKAQRAAAVPLRWPRARHWAQLRRSRCLGRGQRCDLSCRGERVAAF